MKPARIGSICDQHRAHRPCPEANHNGPVFEPYLGQLLRYWSEERGGSHVYSDELFYGGHAGELRERDRRIVSDWWFDLCSLVTPAKYPDASRHIAAL